MSNETFQSPKGVFDILPYGDKPWTNSSLWRYVETKIHEITSLYGFQEIRTPIFEHTHLFTRSAGETSDVVSKEMYTFEDKGGRSISLRPEGTASCVRAFLQHRLYEARQENRFFYIGPMFRYERAQAGRYRQHHQFGVELIGAKSAEVDAEVIQLLFDFYQSLGIQGLHLHINSVGNDETRENYKNAFLSYLEPYQARLSEDSKRRLLTNPLRILDSKDSTDQEILKNAPSILEFLNGEPKDHFERLQKELQALNIAYTLSPTLVRGLDYYTSTVFEVTAGQLGAQNTIGAGGRYDKLVQEFGGPNLPCFGFGTGIERILQTLLEQKADLPEDPSPQLFILPIGDEAKTHALKLAHGLRLQGIKCLVSYEERKLKAGFKLAEDTHSKYVLILGDNELKSKNIELKEVSTQNRLPAELPSLTPDGFARFSAFLSSIR